MYLEETVPNIIILHWVISQMAKKPKDAEGDITMILK